MSRWTHAGTADHSPWRDMTPEQWDRQPVPFTGGTMPPDPTDTSPEVPDTGPRDDDASDPEDDPTSAPVVPTTEDPE